MYMLPRTRQILAALGDELNAELLEACASASLTEAKLRDVTGASHATLSARLQLLEARGLVRRSEVRGPRGRPAVAWTALGQQERARFGQIADQFVLNLLEAQVAEHEQSMRDRSRGAMRLASTDASTPGD
jgi:DNA-binding HxlR family transcriptional regulator